MFLDIMQLNLTETNEKIRIARVEMNATLPNTLYKSQLLEEFSNWYGGWHGYVSLIICAIGIPLNVINIVVLTRKKLQTPINCILTWLAVFDMATMISYVPFAYHFYCQYNANSLSAGKNSLPWMHYLLVHLNVSSTAHTISIWLGVSLAILRYRHIHSTSKGNLTRIRRLVRARLIVCLVVLGSMVVMIPIYLSTNLTVRRFADNSTGYTFTDEGLGSKEITTVVLIGTMLYGTLAKLVPCLLIIIYGGLLLKTLNTSSRNQCTRNLLKGGGKTIPQRNVDTTRTTAMLLIVIVLFLLTELPQGILLMCCIFLENFFEGIYIPLGDCMDIFALINNSVNFVLYCTMSQEFRTTFLMLFRYCHKRSEEQKTYILNNIQNTHLHHSLTTM